MFGRLKKFVEDREGLGTLERLIILLAMVGIALTVAIKFRDDAIGLGDKAYQESYAEVDQISSRV